MVHNGPGNEIIVYRPRSANHGYPAITLVPSLPSGDRRSTMKSLAARELAHDEGLVLTDARRPGNQIFRID